MNRFLTRSLAFATLTLLLALPAASAYGDQVPQTFAGRLFDASCKAANPTGKCEIAENTKSFGLETSDGKVLRFDDDGNAKAAAVLKDSPRKTGSVMVAVTGTASGDIVKVSAIRIQ